MRARHVRNTVLKWMSLTTIGAVLVGFSSNSLADEVKSQTKRVPPSHVIYVVADNIHLEDIQKMPHIMSFLKQGTQFLNDHTILDSHTQDGMLSDLTGQYPSKTGVPDQSFYANETKSSFLYWNTNDHDGLPHVTTTAPWQVFNQHGYNVGAIGTPDMELEGKSEVKNMNQSLTTKPEDYLGVAIHSADGNTILGSPWIDYIYHAPTWMDPSKNLGAFPGWGNPDPNWPLQATYEMQTHGVPVTFTYLHDVHEVNGQQAGPGQYNSVIAQYDQAFDTFFRKLNAAGINETNTLFVFTTDEGDHYMPKGEQGTNLQAWLTENPIYSTPASNLKIVSDSGALVYLKDPTTHQDLPILPQTIHSLQAVPGWNYIANPTELKVLHVASESAPSRTPSFILFSKPDVWYNTYGSKDFVFDPNYLWNHGTISPDILNTWLGMVGPGIKKGYTSNQWLDHTDTMPTIYSALGFDLTQSKFDGIPAIDGLDLKALPIYQNQSEIVRRASELYKQLNAPVGQFGMYTLQLSTLASIDANTIQGEKLNNRIEQLGKIRDEIAQQLQQFILSSANGQQDRDGDEVIQSANQFVQSLSSIDSQTGLNH